ncbi:cytochrome B [Putridiphycobacter roseus]|uniref:Cytochrome B n=1 Tax=Putridiphycobacter roseus TaxID=2219161 RepID=A0A2W1MWP3_9FLAO|nr:cytochrome B [Putridiphycobacter roseus]PZE15814.1 cytochrome B [Putridiphycobacter roseus]
MYNGLLHAHSGLRWIALFFILAAIIISFTSKGKPYSAMEKKLALFTLISFHIQLVIGLYLYFTSPKVNFFEGFMKDSVARFFNVEHIFGMLIAIVLITMGYSKSKKKTEASAKRKTIKTFYIIGLLILIATIPWPFRGLGGSWF